MQQDALDNKDEPLRNDIRLLGRILGDTVREQEGDSVFELVERVRQTAVRFARDGDPAARNDKIISSNLFSTSSLAEGCGPESPSLPASIASVDEIGDEFRGSLSSD